MPSTLNRRDRWLLGGLFVAAGLSLALYTFYRTEAFPEHAMRFDVNRTEAAAHAEDYAKRLGADTSGFMRATRFIIQEEKTYLERELGEKETGELASKLGLWHFTTRYFKPEQTEEMRVSIGTDGRLVGFSHRLPEEASGAKPSREEARTIVEKFLRDNTTIDLTKYTFISASDTKLPNRTNHTLTWEAKGEKLAEATPRVRVELNGDQIASFSQFLDIPETWSRDFEKQYSRNVLAGQVAGVLGYFLFSIAVIITFILHYRKINLRTRFPIAMATIVSLVMLMSTLNMFPLKMFSYPTSTSWPSFVLQGLLMSVIAIVYFGITLYLTLAAGEALYREVWPRRQSLESLLGRGLLTRRTALGLIIGSLVGIINLAYVIGYYFLGRKIGFWSPVEVPYDDLMSTGAPWLAALSVGLFAAVNEEGTFRLFGLAFFKRYLKYTWLGVVITSVVWAFLHSTYPQMPWYVRGLELTVVGVAWSWLFLRYGFLASVSAHYVFNSLITALFLIGTGSPYVIVSSFLVVAIPLALGITSVIRAKRRGGFISEESVSNKELTARMEREKERTAPRREVKLPYFPALPFPRWLRTLLVLAIPASIGLLFYITPRLTLDAPSQSVNRTEAISEAADALRKRGVAPESYRAVATTDSSAQSPSVQRYLSENAPIGKLREIYERDLPQIAWRVRFFRFGEKEEYAVRLLASGAVYNVEHTLQDTTPGAKLSPDEAEHLAKSYAQSVLGYDLSRYATLERTQSKLVDRIDHTVLLERKEPLVAEAKLQTRIRVSGEEITSAATYAKIPEEWSLEQGRSTLLNTVGFISLSIIVLAATLLIFRVFLRLLKDKLFPTRLAFVLAAAGTAIMIIGVINGLATFFAGYTTNIAPATFIALNALGQWARLGGYFFGLAIVIGTTIGLWKRSQLPVPSLSAETYPERRDGVFAAYALPLIMGTLTILTTYLLYTTGLARTVPPPASLPGLSSYIPALSPIANLPLTLIAYLALALGVVAIAGALKRKSLMIIAALIYVALNVMAQARDWQSALATTIRQLAIFLPLIGIIALVRLNAWAYALMIFAAALLPSGFYLILQPDMTLRINGIVLLTLGVAPLIAFLIHDWRQLFGLSIKKSRQERKSATRLKPGH